MRESNFVLDSKNGGNPSLHSLLILLKLLFIPYSSVAVFILDLLHYISNGIIFSERAISIAFSMCIGILLYSCSLYMCFMFSLQIEISRESNEISFGLTLSKEISEDDLGKAIIINTIVVGSPAYFAGIIAKDILIAIDGHKIESLKQAAKMIKNKSR